MTPAARLRTHWPEYLAEAAGLGLFMISASLFASLLEHPASPVRQAVDDPTLRRLLMGLAMGSTAVALTYSPLGARSGAHVNPATTFTFWRLGRVHRLDAAAYVVSQFAGACAGMLASAALFNAWIDAPQVHYVATVPGRWGHLAAFGAEAAITFVMMSTVLRVSNHAALSRYTGLCAGRAGGAVHHARGAGLRHEPQPRAVVRPGPAGGRTRLALDLLRSAAAGDAAGG